LFAFELWRRSLRELNIAAEAVSVDDGLNVLERMPGKLRSAASSLRQAPGEPPPARSGEGGHRHAPVSL